VLFASDGRTDLVDAAAEIRDESLHSVLRRGLQKITRLSICSYAVEVNLD
jgi:hypothetical protein